MIKENKNLTERPPVVVILGHVDHGKSSILEAIKGLKIIDKESGGITQHIGAYEVEHLEKRITFVDTPGHEAFSSMRSRGARVADIAVLVVAADEGVKKQTEEAIEHIKKAEIPMVVAINKIDKPEANPDRVTQQLAEKEVYLESLGGKVPCSLVSAKEKKGLEDLLEMILLISEMEELKADFSVPASGIIVESHLDSLKGPTTTLIVENGTLKKGDVIATKSAMGKAKALENSQGEKINEASPSMPAVVNGFEKVPFVGEKFQVFSDTDSAKKFLEEKKETERIVKPENKSDEKVNLVLKADFFGSLEAIQGIINEIPQERVSLNIVKAEVGDINESDIKTARSSNSQVIGFKVKIKSGVTIIAERDNVHIFLFDIIYEIVEQVRKLMEKVINPKTERTDWGKAKVLALFLKEKNRQILGCKVIQGETRKLSNLEVFRMNQETNEEEIVGRGKVVNLKKGEKETEKVFQGEECGILYEGNIKINEQDVLLSYTEQEEDISGII
jgi:translation initiation factor IF-2